MRPVRIIPCLLMENKKLIKTTRYKNPVYIGDPINAIKIYNDLFVDELILLDIGQSTAKKPIDYTYLSMLTSECFIPLCYGGGVDSLDTAAKLYSLGIEKLAVNSAAYEDIRILKQIAAQFGSQSLVGVIDYRKKYLRGYRVIINNKKYTRYSPLDYARMLEDFGVGELIINAIDQDGMMTGYDAALLAELAEAVSIPIIANCGAGHLKHMHTLFKETGINAFAAGSLFVYSGGLKGVLINYPNRQEIDNVFC
jgi:cyclase